MPGLAPSLFLCTLSTTNALTCRTENGTEIPLREDGRRAGMPASLGILRAVHGGICHIDGNGGTLACFNGDGVKITLRDTAGRDPKFIPNAGAESTSVHACGLDAAGALRCFFTASGEEVAFERDGRKVEPVGVARFVLSDALLCARTGRTLVSPLPPTLDCYTMPANSRAKAQRLDLVSESGRTYGPEMLGSGDFIASGPLACLASNEGALCFDAMGKRIPLKNKAGFPTLPSVVNGLFLSSNAMCALDAAGSPSCYAVASGKDAGAGLEFKNALGFRDEPPVSRKVLMHGDLICFEPKDDAGKQRVTAPPAIACYLAGARIAFLDPNGRSVDLDARSFAKPRARAGHLCGVSPKGLAQCYALSTGKAVVFLGPSGFATEFDASRDLSLGSDALCAVSALSDVRCFRYGGESIAFKNALGGEVRVEGISKVRVAE